MKILNQILNASNPAQDFIASNLPFMIEGDQWEFVSDINEATIIPVHCDIPSNIPHTLRSDQILLVIALYHIDDMMFTPADIDRVLKYMHRYHDKVIFVHTNIANKNPEYVFYDHMFNREKLYFVDYDKFGDAVLSGKTWTIVCSREIYRQNPITKTPIKQVLSPTRIYNFGSEIHPRMSFRQRLSEILHRRAKAYMGDTQNGIVLETNSSSSLVNSQLTLRGGTWYPVADRYYNTSYVSVYVETLTQNNEVRCVTEKSFDPLMKGNFILPFGYPGLIRDIRESYGFKLPNWIDYSYDDILDPEERFQAFLVSLDDLLKKDLKDLHRLYLEDKHILLHNRQVFIDKPYDKLHDKIVDVIKLNQWNLPKTV
jgi:hypothetical protein